MITNCRILHRYSNGRLLIEFRRNGVKKYEVVG